MHDVAWREGPRRSTVTTQFTGAFRDDPAEQIRFMTLVKGGHSGG